LYYVQARALVADNSPATNTVNAWFMIEVNGSAYGSPNNIYGNYVNGSSPNFPSGMKGRGDVSAMVYLAAGDTIKIKALGANSAIAQTLKNDGSTKLMVVKIS